MKIISWNINGLRAIIRKNKLSEILNRNYDIYNFQETKIDKDSLNKLKIESHAMYSSFSEIKKGYSGVSTWTNLAVLKSSKIGIPKFDNEGRVIITEYKSFFLINAYFPNGREDHSRVKYKLKCSYKILELAKQLENKKPVIICGDVNTAHKPIDLARPKQNKNSTGFLEIERKFIDDLEKNGFIDCFRYFHSQKVQYSWWSYRGNARKTNVGWRLDYFFVSQSMKNKIKNCYYLDDFTGSDHCPVVLEFNED